MSTKRMLSIVLVASAVMLAVGIGPRVTHTARALPPIQASVTVPYSGSLADEAGQPVADGAYDFTFALYEGESGGEPLWTETQEGVAVQGGAFTALLGSVTPILPETLDGGARWLEVGVRGPGEAEFTLLSPRQKLSAAAPAAPAGLTAPAALSCAHTHLNENWVGSYSNYALRIQNSGAGDGVVGEASAFGKSGVYGNNTGAGFGVFGRSASGTGVRGVSTSYDGVVGEASAADRSGVYGHNTAAGYGVFGRSATGIGVGAESRGAGADHAALRANNTLTTTGMAAYFTNSSGYATANLTNNGTGEVLYLQSHGGTFIRALNAGNDPKFRLEYNGEAYADGNWHGGGADFAEMLPAVEGLEPGDLLVIGPDGKLARSTEPYQASVAGVYSTQPGFVGGHPVEGPTPGTIPLAVVGVVPVKASAENGSIAPGDLLVASSTPGHAMRAGSNPPIGTVIGKALEALESGTGVIQMLVVLQ